MNLGNPETNFDAALRFVEFGIRKKAESDRESASGPGSSKSAAKFAAKLLSETVREQNLNSILDLGCGDWNWMQDLGIGSDTGLPLRYEGWDANERLIDYLRKRFATTSVTFLVQDVVLDEYPKVDLIIARDILFHMRPELVLKIIRKAREKCRFFLSTSFLNMRENENPEQYLPIENWYFSKINLNIEPYNLGTMMRVAYQEPECSIKGQKRYICLYEFEPEGQA